MNRTAKLAVLFLFLGMAMVGVQPTTAAQDEGRITNARTKSGVLVSTLKRGDTMVRVYGARISDVQERGSALSSDVSVSFAADPQVARRSGIEPTVYEMSLASGMSEAEACEFAAGMDPYGCKTSTQVRTSRASARYLDSRCYLHRTYKGDGHKDNYLCNARYILQNPHGAPIIIGNKMKATGSTHNPGTLYDKLTKVGVQAAYKWSRAHAIDWDPYTTVIIEDTCREYSSTVQSRNGVSVTSQTSVCPDKLTPWHSPEFQYFGSKWIGGPDGDDRGVVATSAVWMHSDKKAYRLRSYLAWS